jgi:hypothetical protein
VELPDPGAFAVFAVLPEIYSERSLGFGGNAGLPRFRAFKKQRASRCSLLFLADMIQPYIHKIAALARFECRNPYKGSDINIIKSNICQINKY